MKIIDSEDIYKELSTVYLKQDSEYVLSFSDFGDAYLPSFVGTIKDRTVLRGKESSNIGTITIGESNDKVDIVVAKDDDGKNRMRYEMLVRGLKSIFGPKIKPLKATKENANNSVFISYVFQNISKEMKELYENGYFQANGYNVVTQESLYDDLLESYTNRVISGDLDELEIPEAPIFKL